MKIDQLIYFVETAKEEHIGRAAKILGISPSAISHSIAALEGELQIKLFQKKGKNIFLTNEGQSLLLKSDSLITQFKNLKYDLLTENNEKNHYSICASHTLSSKFVVNTWKEMQRDYTNTSIDLLTLRSSDVIKSVLNREADIGICFSPQEHPDLEVKHLFTGELLLNVRKKHPLLKSSKKIKDISNYDAVLPKSFSGIDICLQHPMFEKFGINPKATCLTDSYDISSELITRSNYWGLTPDILINKTNEIIKPSKGWSAPYTISIVWKRNRYTPKFFKQFSNSIENSLSKY